MKIHVICGVLLLLLLPRPGVAGKYDYIDINNPVMRKIPIAAPLFRAISGAGEEENLRTSLSDLLAQTLEYTGYFKVLDRSAYLYDPSQPPLLTTDINFKNWVAIRSDLLVTGGVLLEGDALILELRLFDTLKETQMLGSRYKGGMNQSRQMIRRFCSEIIKLLTGKDGFFDSQLAFISTVNGNKELFTSDFDGYNPQQFTRDGSITLSPAWSSDGRWLAYTSYKAGKPDLYIANRLDKRGAVVAKKGINISPSWVPGRAELAATLSFTGDQEIYLLTESGKIIKRLTDSEGIDVSPTWSPDGRKMAFVSQRAGTPQIHVLDVETEKVQRVSFEGRQNTQPAWSPKGDKIAYTSLTKGQQNICVVNVDGTGMLQLTHGSGDNESPSWSPDGSMLVFSSTREGTSRIFVMTAFGTDQRKVLTLPGSQSDPRWSPNF